MSFSTATGSGDAVTLGGGASVAALVPINVFAVAFGVTWGPVMWVGARGRGGVRGRRGRG